MLICSGIPFYDRHWPWWKVLVFVIVTLAIIGLSFYFFAHDYQKDRIRAWRNPDSYKKTIGYQIYQSLVAIGSGGVTGLGLGNSIEKQLWLPESNNDFIFSVVCEELGFVGAVLVILLFVLFLVEGFWLAFHAENRYCTLVGIGIMAQIAWQVFCNIAVVTNTLPNTGISLPFFSYGGTALIIPGIMCVEPKWYGQHEQPFLNDDKYIPGLKMAIDAVHEEAPSSPASSGCPATCPTPRRTTRSRTARRSPPSTISPAR